MSLHTESSLTTPEDRNLDNRWKPDQSIPSLNNNETNEALKELNDYSFIRK